MLPNYELWQLCKEISLLEMPEDVLYRPFQSLSGGEQTKILLAALFQKPGNFLLIDEPTNHLDAPARDAVAKYLNRKHGFILVSHDRNFLDSCVDHILAINKADVTISQGNFSAWQQNKEYQDNFEISRNEKLKKDIGRLHESSKRTANWSEQVEKTKNGTKVGGLRPDRGRIGHKAAKMMQSSKNTEKNKNRAIDQKSKLLKNIETAEDLKLNPLRFHHQKLIYASNLSVFYQENPVFKNLNFEINSGDRVGLLGKNGCGKTSLIKLILGREIRFEGELHVPGDLKISYISQDTSHLRGLLSDYVKKQNVDESLFKAILRKLDFDRVQFEKNLEELSEGQKKKLLISTSLCRQAHLYIWDEPLNFIDLLSRIQIENLILRCEPTMVFVEHDHTFFKKIATKTINF
jgi:lincosamide and streptogramin A transport system ATP-binding/permease protein